MEITDIAATARLAHEHGVLLAVDNTFMSPYFQRPLELGADVVVHSTTKYLNGHSDGVGGVVILNDEALAERLKFLQNAAGAILGPFDSWLVLRGVKTLAVRMRKHDENGMAIATFLSKHLKVKHVHYPGLPSHPQHELARKQMGGFGGMLSFETGSLGNARTVLKSVRLCSLAESLGGVETLISHPASMTHASVPAEERARYRSPQRRPRAERETIARSYRDDLLRSRLPDILSSPLYRYADAPAPPESADTVRQRRF